MFFLVVGEGLLLSSLNLFADCSQADEATLVRLRKEAPPAWERIRNAYSGKEFMSEEKRVDSISVSEFPQPVIVSELSNKRSIARLDDHLRIQTEMIEKKPLHPPKSLKQAFEMQTNSSAGTRLLNQQYTGVISVEPSTKIHSFLSLANEVKSEEAKLKLDYMSIPALRMGNGLLDRSIFGFPHFVGVDGYPNYLISDAVEFTNDYGDALVRVSLANAIVKNGEMVATSEYMVEGEAVLDPSRNWCVVEYHDKYEGKDGAPDSRLDIIVTPSSEPEVSHPIQIESTNAFSDGIQWTTSEKFTPLVDTDLTEDECYFSAYGLPEPAEFRRSWITTGILLAIVCVLLFLVIIRRRRAENLSTQ